MAGHDPAAVRGLSERMTLGIHSNLLFCPLQQAQVLATKMSKRSTHFYSEPAEGAMMSVVFTAWRAFIIQEREELANERAKKVRRKRKSPKKKTTESKERTITHSQDDMLVNHLTAIVRAK